MGTVLGLIGETSELSESSLHDIPAPVLTPPPAQEPAAEKSPEGATAVVAPPHEEPHHDKASPLVRRMARDLGIDLSTIEGSGPDGRITQDDLTAYTTRTVTPPTPAAAEPAQEITPASVPSPATPLRPVTAMRQAIATAVSHSWQTIPHFSVSVEIDMDACREVVRELKGSEHPIGYNALLIKACAVVLQEFPLLRATDPAGGSGIHISFAVALEDGLLMPVIRGCDTLTAAEISRESERLAEKCRQGKLTSEEMSGGCFSVSNLGMYGVDDFTALIMPGQVAILAAGSVAERPIVRQGVLAVAATVRVTLCSDHRLIDGAYAARFLAGLRSALEKPVSLLV